MKKILSTLLINFAIFSSLLVGIETIAQLYYLSRTGKVLLFENTRQGSFVHRKLFQVHPYLVGVPRALVEVEEEGKTISTTALRTRWTGAAEADQGLIRVAVLGGSSAFGTGVSDRESWPALLQHKLGPRYAVINYGVPGYSTAEAIVQMGLILPEKAPHLVIFYEGWNDIRNYHEPELGADYYGHGMRQFNNLGLDFKNTFATAWIIGRWKRKLFPPEHLSEPPRSDPDPFVDRIYSRNLETLKALAQHMGAYSLFVPQVLNYPAYRSKPGSEGWTRTIENSAMPGLMDRFNRIMEGLCEDAGDCTVLNRMTEQPWGAEDFVDAGHLSREGGEKFAQLIADFVRGRFERGRESGN